MRPLCYGKATTSSTLPKAIWSRSNRVLGFVDKHPVHLLSSSYGAWRAPFQVRSPAALATDEMSVPCPCLVFPPHLDESLMGRKICLVLSLIPVAVFFVLGVAANGLIQLAFVPDWNLKLPSEDQERLKTLCLLKINLLTQNILWLHL